MTKLLTLPVLVAAISGVAMAVQGTLNSVLAQKTSLLSATFVVHVLGSLVALAAILVRRVPLLEHDWPTVPWYLYAGGILSVIIVGLVALSIPKIGVCNATTAIIVGQVATAVLIDHFGLFGVQAIPWSIWQIVGLAMFAAGAKLLLH